MDTQNELISLLQTKTSFEEEISNIKQKINHVDESMTEILSKHFSISVGDEFEKFGNIYQIHKFSPVIVSNTFNTDYFELFAECYLLKADGSIDARIKPQYNIIKLNHLSVKTLVEN